MEWNSNDIAKASIRVSISPSRSEEEKLINEMKAQKIKCAAVDIGGNINDLIPKIIERALVAAKRSGVIKECHSDEGALIGATREAILQVYQKATGLNGGGKIGIARHEEHLSVCIFMSIGLLHLNEVVVGLAHRSLANIK